MLRARCKVERWRTNAPPATLPFVSPPPCLPKNRRGQIGSSEPTRAVNVPPRSRDSPSRVGGGGGGGGRAETMQPRTATVSRAWSLLRQLNVLGAGEWRCKKREYTASFWFLGEQMEIITCLWIIAPCFGKYHTHVFRFPPLTYDLFKQDSISFFLPAFYHACWTKMFIRHDPIREGFEALLLQRDM